MLGRHKQLQDIKFAEQCHQEISRHIYIYIYIYMCVCVWVCVSVRVCYFTDFWFSYPK